MATFTANFSKSVKLLGAISAFSVAIIALFPVESFGYPESINTIYKVATASLFIVIAGYIAIRSRTEHAKSQSRTLKLSLLLAGLGSSLLIGLLTYSDLLVGQPENECAYSERQRFVMPLQPSAGLLRLIDRHSDLDDTSNWRLGVANIVCEKEVGGQVWGQVEQTNNSATLLLVSLLVLTTTALFTAITLMLWSMLALERRHGS